MTGRRVDPDDSADAGTDAAADAAAGSSAGAGSSPLPEPVRLRVLAVAADRLGSMEVDRVPAGLRPFARFTPGRRARLAAVPLAAALEGDPVFRQHVAAGLREALPELVNALEAGLVPPAAAPEDVAAVAYLVRPDGWQDYVDRAATALARDQSSSREAAAADLVVRLREQLEAVRASARGEVERLRADVMAARVEAEDGRRRVREALERARRAESAAADAQAALATTKAQAASASTAAEAESRRQRARAGDAEGALEQARRAAREGHSADEMRLRLLLDTVVGAAQGLRRELALAPQEARPADAVAAVAAAAAAEGDSGVGPRARGLEDRDPAVLDALLELPAVHLVVDGYNVTKGGYGELPLEAQRGRLLIGLGALAARTGAEVTCVFDGVDRVTPLAVAPPRGVRLIFSRGETADDLIRRLVRAEPVGRPVVVVSSDREVADGVRRAGARPVAATALLRRLARG